MSDIPSPGFPDDPQPKPEPRGDAPSQPGGAESTANTLDQSQEFVAQVAKLLGSTEKASKADRAILEAAANVSVGSLFQSEAVAITNAMFTSVANYANSSILQTATTAASVRDIQANSQTQGTIRLLLELVKLFDKRPNTTIEGSSIETGG